MKISCIKMLDYLIELRVIDQPLGLERRGIILYEFCQKHYPDYTCAVSRAWIEAGMSLKKQPAERVTDQTCNPS